MQNEINTGILELMVDVSRNYGYLSGVPKRGLKIIVYEVTPYSACRVAFLTGCEVPLSGDFYREQDDVVRGIVRGAYRGKEGQGWIPKR